MAAFKAAVAGRGAMGRGIATSALKAGLDVAGCDVSAAALDAFKAAGGTAAATPADWVPLAATSISVAHAASG